MPAGVGDDQRRLGSEHDQRLLVFGGELPAPLLLRDVEVSGKLVPVNDRRGHEGHDGSHRQRRAELGKAQRPDVAEQVPEPQRFPGAAQVLEQPHPAGQLPEQPGLLFGHPRGEEVRYPSRIVQEGDHPVAGFGERPGGVQNALQHRVEVEAFVDAQAGRAQPGQPVPQLMYLPLLLFGLVHLPALTGPPATGVHAGPQPDCVGA